MRLGKLIPIRAKAACSLIPPNALCNIWPVQRLEVASVGVPEEDGWGS